jgi:type IV secretory pathway TrbD component
MVNARRNTVHKSMNRPLTILGAERRLFFVALITGAALFNLLHSLLGGLILFVAGLLAAQWATRYDPQILRVLLNSSKFKAFYDPAKYQPEKASVLPHVSTRPHAQTI